MLECFSLKGTWAESEICAWKLAGIDDTIDSGVSFGYWIWGQCYVVLEITAKKMETQIYFVKMSFRCYKIIGVTIFSQKIKLYTHNKPRKFSKEFSNARRHWRWITTCWILSPRNAEPNFVSAHVYWCVPFTEKHSTILLALQK